MKQIILYFLFVSGSLTGFSQEPKDIYEPNQVSIGHLHEIGYVCYCSDCNKKRKPDTLRATLIVYYDKGPAILHTKPGFVVRQLGKEEIYLDDKMRVVKSPLEVFSYKIKK